MRRVSSRLNFERKCLKTLSLLGAVCDSDVALPSLKMLEQLWIEVGQDPN